MMTLGIIIGLLIAGGVFLAGGLEAKRKPAYPWRRLDVGFQLTVGGVALAIGGIMALAFLFRIVGLMAQP